MRSKPKLTMRDAEAIFTLAQSVEIRLQKVRARDPERHDVAGVLREAARMIDKAGCMIRDGR